MLFTTVERSTRLLQYHSSLFKGMLGEYRRVMREAVLPHCCAEVWTYCYSFFFVFTSARYAAAAALDSLVAL